MMLLKSGYLTIKEKSEEGDLVLSYPNLEVKEAMYTFLMDDVGYAIGGSGVHIKHLKKAFMNNNLERAHSILTALFSGLAFDVYTHQNQ